MPYLKFPNNNIIKQFHLKKNIYTRVLFHVSKIFLTIFANFKLAKIIIFHINLKMYFHVKKNFGENFSNDTFKTLFL